MLSQVSSYVHIFKIHHVPDNDVCCITCLIVSFKHGIELDVFINSFFSVKLFGYKNKDLKVFDQENILKLFDKKLVEKKLIKAIYLS